MTKKRKAVLLLQDGTLFEGYSFGWHGKKVAEVVFNTALTGYEEILTDPSYCGQAVAMCYPHIGNYGINCRDIESYKIWLDAIIVKEYSNTYSNYKAKMSLAQYLKDNKVMGIEGVDTRALVRRLREKGSMKGIVAVGGFTLKDLKKYLKDAPDIGELDLVSRVNRSPHAVFRKYKETAGGSRPRVLLIDYGTKLNIIRTLKQNGLSVKVMPAKTDIDEVIKEKADGVMLSNGPGDPETVRSGVKLAHDLIQYSKKEMLPVMGICLGHQLIGLGSGGRTYKLKFGHHGSNHPVKNLDTGKIEVTSQNHNYCVDQKTMPSDFEVTHINLNDGTVEGLRHKAAPIISFQYHPESSPGPHDSEYLFSQFAGMIDGKKKRHK